MSNKCDQHRTAPPMIYGAETRRQYESDLTNWPRGTTEDEVKGVLCDGRTPGRVVVGMDTAGPTSTLKGSGSPAPCLEFERLLVADKNGLVNNQSVN